MMRYTLEGCSWRQKKKERGEKSFLPCFLLEYYLYLSYPSMYGYYAKREKK